MVLRQLLDAGLLHGDSLCVNGETMAENLRSAPGPNGEMVRGLDDPLRATDGTVVLKGYLAANGAVCKAI